MHKLFRVVSCLIITTILFHFQSGESRSGDYEDYLKSQVEDFQSYKDARDAEFIGFLKEQWREYNINKGLVLDNKPKPVKLPVAEPTAAPALPKKMKIVKKVLLPKKKPVDVPVETPSEKKVDVPKDIPVVKPTLKPVDKVPEPLKEIPVAKPEGRPAVEPPAAEKQKTVSKPETSVSEKPVPVDKKPATPVVIKPVEKPKAIPTEPKTGDKKISTPVPPRTETRKAALTIDFYMTPVAIYGKYDFPAMDGNRVSKEMIASFWDKMSQLDYDSFIVQVKKYKTDLKLNDWGYHYVLYRIGLEQYRGNKNMANLFTWYMSSKSGYESRIGYNDTQVFLLMPSKNNLYSIPFLTLNNKKYYSLFFDDNPSTFKTLYTYQGSYPEAKKIMDFSIPSSPEIPKIMKQKNLVFDLNKKNVEINAVYNKNIVDFFKYYPQTNMKVYFDSFMSQDLEYALVKSLKPLVEGKTEAEAVNNLLRFVQKAFNYKTDDGQFGREKYMIPEETVFYPYSDCEDRSFFFAYLVRKLTGLEVVGLDYPGHVATGVRFTDNLPGDYVMDNNNVKYIVCDPTYINATLGMAMPQFKGTRPDIVQIR